MKSNNWINFKELRAKLSFVEVFDLYGIKDLTTKGKQLVGFCPIPSHIGNQKTPSFSAHPEKGIFQCFGCGAKGNILDFTVLMEGGNPERGVDVRKAALKLNKLALPLASHANGHSGQENPNARLLVNQPLNFRLKDLDPQHPYLVSRGFKREVLDDFGVGYCCRGVFSGRITIPLRDQSGTLIGYAGRVIDDATITPQNPKYLFPGRREFNGDILEFKKSLFLYNGHHVTEAVDDLIVVEGFPSAWWITQHGFDNVVALMGSSFSKEQLEFILSAVTSKGRIWIMTDGDKAGIRCGNELCKAIASSRLCRFVYEENRQPTDYGADELNAILNG
jgi:DNA primase